MATLFFNHIHEDTYCNPKKTYKGVKLMEFISVYHPLLQWMFPVEISPTGMEKHHHTMDLFQAVP